MVASLNIEEVPVEARETLMPILGVSFTGLYLWHARRTLRSARWVRSASQGSSVVGLAMSTMFESSGYVYYAAVTPSERGKGVGGVLVDDALGLLRAEGAREIFACARAENAASIQLLRSRDFVATSFPEIVRSKGFVAAVSLWIRMVVTPGEKVFTRDITDSLR